MHYMRRKPFAVVEANLCVRGPLKVTGKEIRGMGEAADEEAHTIHTMNIIAQRQYFVARCLISCVGNTYIHTSLLHSMDP
jgi:hypothetical protein